METETRSKNGGAASVSAGGSGDSVPAPAPARLLFITSSAHSGSTLLDLISGTIPGVFSTGEIAALPRQLQAALAADGSPVDSTPCTCLNSFLDCAVWSRVVAELSEATGIDVRGRPRRFKMDLRVNPRTGFRRKVRLNHDLYIHAIQHGGPWAWFERFWSRCHRRAILNNWLLFDTVARVSDARVVVDSSKSLSRLRMLHSHRPDDMVVIVLMRDIRGIAFSAIKRRRDPLDVARSYVRHCNRTYRVLGRMGGLRRLTVQYEEMCRHPVRTRSRIAALLGLPDPGGDLEIDTRRYHLVGGNAMRFQGPITINLSEEWRENLDAATLAAVEEISRRRNRRPGRAIGRL